MKIVIFDPYFESLGGGEKVLAVMADRLSRSHDVTILVKNPVNKVKTEEYFNLDLSKVTFAPLPPESFITRNLQHIWLPGRWKSILYDRAGFMALKKLPMDIFINGLYMSSLPSPAPKSIYMCMFPQKLNPGKTGSSPLRRWYNTFTDHLETRLVGNRQQAIDSYTVVQANSNFTAGWIKRYWNREAVVVHPPCDNYGPPSQHKKNIIYSVGRFFADNGSSHHKRHDRMIEAFIKLGRPDWELHLVGTASKDPGHNADSYLDMLRDMAKGHKNIFIKPNFPGKEITKLRRDASIYWHATGLGYDATKFPENQEHFGMVTAEAMSAAAVPIVYKGAGQMEVVSHNKNGMLWATLDELVAYTKQVIDNPKLKHRLAESALHDAKKFDRKAFLKNVDKLILKASHE